MKCARAKRVDEKRNYGRTRQYEGAHQRRLDGLDQAARPGETGRKIERRFNQNSYGKTDRDASRDILVSGVPIEGNDGQYHPQGQ
jgi:hypothetical protein